MIRRTLGLIGLAGGIALVLVACGDEDEPADKYPTADSFCAAKAAEECKVVAVECSVSNDKCADARKGACGAAAGTATEQGRTYRASNAEACLTKTAEVYKDRVIDRAKEEAFEDTCARVFTGTKKENEPCTDAYQCEASLVCDLAKGFCGKKTEKKENEACNNPGDLCAKGSYCQDRGGNRVCAPKGKLGESCHLKDMPCQEDLRCNGSSCVALIPAGDLCDTSDECVTAFCNADKKCQAKQYASETGTCRDFGGS